jgi:hypothetical protein
MPALWFRTQETGARSSKRTFGPMNMLALRARLRVYSRLEVGMVKWLLSLVVVALVGCIAGSEEGEPKILGYSAGKSCGPEHPTCNKGLGSDKRVWVATRSKTDTGEFLIFVYRDTVENRSGFQNSRIGKALATKGAELLDAGDQCMTVHQTGKDTIVTGGDTTVVLVPIEPCLPYLLDKDLP